MIIFAAVVGLLTYASLVVVGSMPSPLADIGLGIFLACIVVATVVAVINRSPRSALPGTIEELTRRQEREQYRNLARRDPILARNMAVGRPDLSRNYSDGGLLDLNALSAEALSHFGALSIEDSAADRRRPAVRPAGQPRRPDRPLPAVRTHRRPPSRDRHLPLTLTSRVPA